MEKLFSLNLTVIFLFFSTSCALFPDNPDRKRTEKQLFDRFAEGLPANLKPYKVDIVQGNYITKSMVSNLSKGQTRVQVQSILGTPLIIDPFRKDRWDYIFLINRGVGTREIHRFMVVFEGDRVIGWEGEPIDEKSGKFKMPTRKF